MLHVVFCIESISMLVGNVMVCGSHNEVFFLSADKSTSVLYFLRYLNFFTKNFAQLQTEMKNNQRGKLGKT